MWRDIEIVAAVRIGGKDRLIELRQGTGTGKSDSFGLTVDHYFWGAFFKRRDEWVTPEQLTSNEVQLLIKMIEEALAYDRLDITLRLPFGDEYRSVNIFEVSPWVFAIYMVKCGYDYYRARISKVNGEWTGEINHGAWEDLTPDDVWLLGDIIDVEKAKLST